MNGWCYSSVTLSTCVGVTLPPPAAGLCVFVCLCALLPPCACLKEEKHPRAPVPKGGGGGKRPELRSVSAEEGARRRAALAGPLPGACPGSLHARSARGVSGSPAHPHKRPGTLLHTPRHRGVRAGPARPMSPRRGSARRCPASPPRSRDSPGRPRPGPQPRRHPQLCAPSPEGAGQPSGSLAGRGPAVGGGF